MADGPAGWTVAFGEAGRRACLDYVELRWTDIRPLSLIKQSQRD
ncbi:MbtH family NRPS accessory protein [Nonomuraea sp. NPDC002799]